MMTIIRGSAGRRHFRPHEREAGAFRVCMSSLLLLLVLVQQQSSLCNAYSLTDFLAAYNDPSVHDHEVKANIVLTASLPPLTKSFKLLGKGPGGSVSIDGASRYTGIRTSKDIHLENLEMRNFKTHRNGAALEAIGGKTVIHSCTFRSNSANGAQAAGGAIWFQSVNFKITDSFFTENRAGTLGGAIYSENAVAGLVHNTAFTVNKATGSGGAIASFKGRQFKISSCVFNSNKAVTRHGGAVHFDKDYVYVSGTQFSQNVASRFGGAIRFIADGVVGSLSVCRGNIFPENRSETTVSNIISVFIDFRGRPPSPKSFFCEGLPIDTLIEPEAAWSSGCQGC